MLVTWKPVKVAARLLASPDLTNFRAAILWAAGQVGKPRPGDTVQDIVEGAVIADQSKIS